MKSLLLILTASFFISFSTFAQLKNEEVSLLEPKFNLDISSEDTEFVHFYKYSYFDNNMFSSANPLSYELQEDWSMKRKFWLNFGIGLGSTTIKGDDRLGKEIKLSGMSMTSVLSLGAFITENQVLFGDFFGLTISDPTYKYDGVETSSTIDYSVGWSGGGVGLAHYFTPNSFFIKGAVGISSLSIDVDDETIGETQNGWYASIGAAKEWPISKKVSLGIAGHGFLGSMKDKEVDGHKMKFNASGFGVTATLAWVPRGLKP